MKSRINTRLYYNVMILCIMLLSAIWAFLYLGVIKSLILITTIFSTYWILKSKPKDLFWGLLYLLLFTILNIITYKVFPKIIRDNTASLMFTSNVVLNSYLIIILIYSINIFVVPILTEIVMKPTYPQFQKTLTNYLLRINLFILSTISIVEYYELRALPEAKGYIYLIAFIQLCVVCIYLFVQRTISLQTKNRNK